MSHRFPRLRFFQHNPSGPHAVQPVIDHATVTSTQVIQGTVSVTGTVGQVFQLAAAASDALGHPVSGVTVTWSVLDNTVASVDSTGLVTMLRTGTTTVTATVDGRAYPTVVSVVTTQQGVDWTTVNLLPIGDSITHGNNAIIPTNDMCTRIAAALTSLGATVQPQAAYVGGNAGTAYAAYATDIAPRFVVGKTNIAHVWFGANDLNNCDSGRELQNYFGLNVQLWSRLAADGWKVIVATIIDRNDATAISAGFRTSQPMVNAWLRENAASLIASGTIHALNDIAADYELGSIGAVDDTTIYGDNAVTNYEARAIWTSPDNTHPNHYGHYLLANSVLGSLYKYFGLTRPTIKPGNLVMAFEPFVAQRGLGTYLPELMPPQWLGQSNSTTTTATPYASWEPSRKRISLGWFNQPFVNPTGFTLVIQSDMSASDLINNAQYLGGLTQNSNMCRYGVNNVGKPFFQLFFDPADNSKSESATYAGTALTKGPHVVAISYNPVAARGSRFNMVVDGAAPNFTEGQSGADGTGGVMTGSITWNDDMALGTDRFPSFPAPTRVRSNVLMWNTPLSTADMQSACTYLSQRWPIAAGW